MASSASNSNKRPGTVDYSKWQNFEDSDDEDCSDSRSEEDEDEDDDDEARQRYYRRRRQEISREQRRQQQQQQQEQRQAQGSAIETNNNNTRDALLPLPDLKILQDEWGIGEDDDNTNDDTTKNKNKNNIDDDNDNDNDNENEDNQNKKLAVRKCSSCKHVGGSLKSCSRCKMVWYCNEACQRQHFPIHRLECISKNEHMLYWGVFNNNNNNNNTTHPLSSLSSSKNTSSTNLVVLRQKALEARMMTKRRRVLKLAAAAAAIERAQRRQHQHQHTKGEGKDGKNSNNESREEMCSICQCEFTVRGDTGTGLQCPSSHHMCYECSGIFVESIMSEIEVSYPPKCPLCKALLPKDQFDRQLTTQQQVAVRTVEAKRKLLPNQVLTKCPECDHFEVNETPGPIVWYCGQCSITTCFVCNKNVRHGKESDHDMCRKFRTVKDKIEEAVRVGAVMACPRCDLQGRKDDACTHMQCVKCGTDWCYVCGLAVDDCDKAPPRPGREENDLYLHNRHWETNYHRCPMYLTQVLEVDLNWLGENWEENATDEDFADDEKCLDHFHRFRTIKMLQEVREEVGNATFDQAFGYFDSIKNSGYTVEEIISTGTDTLIDREEYIRYNHRMEDENEDEDEGDDDNNDIRHHTEEDEDSESDNDEDATEEERMRQAVAASEASMLEDGELRMAIEESLEQATCNNNDDEEHKGEVKEEEAEEEEEEDMFTTAVEDQHMRQVLAASEGSALEDETMRITIEESLFSANK